MWYLENHTPYRAESTWGRDQDGVHQWIVAVKATHDIKADGSLALAEEQTEPLLVPQYVGEAGISSLRYEADLVAPKPTSDVLLNGTAYAPDGRPSRSFLVELSVGPVRKQIKVVGDREWIGGVFGCKPSTAEPVTHVPIIYERAYGGFDQEDSNPKNQRLDPRNPVGTGVAVQTERLVGRLAPNFEYPTGSLERSGPAGFGAIDISWSPRRELHGTYDEAWNRDRRPLLPADWNARSLLCSPEDQRPDQHLRGGEPVELINLTPDGRLRFALPKIYLTFTTLIDNRVEEHRSRLATVIIEPDYPRVITVWTTCLACRNDGDYLEETVIREKPFI
ncbi:MAG: DUF2169 domain-containing protein [Bryobacterales bacterium]|nr:DUF2169 domain-containing protein [Bryobacterales bacterium]